MVKVSRMATLLGKAVFRECGYGEWSVDDGSLEFYDGQWWASWPGDAYPLTRDEARIELQRAGILDSDGRATP